MFNLGLRLMVTSFASMMSDVKFFSQGLHELVDQVGAAIGAEKSRETVKINNRAEKCGDYQWSRDRRLKWSQLNITCERFDGNKDVVKLSVTRLGIRSSQIQEPVAIERMRGKVLRSLHERLRGDIRAPSVIDHAPNACAFHFPKVIESSVPRKFSVV